VVNEYVAVNPNTPAKVLAHLSQDEHASVRNAVSANHNTPPFVILFN
jgi:hypothetical protein